jgi:D-alanyl-lipoteichoic acid acyltransferase DltB (MBOAT superfamily)
MQFNSYSYLLLLIPVVGLFWALPDRVRRWYVLAVSIVYYATWNAPFIAVPLLLCVGVHFLAQGLIRNPQHARSWFRGAIAYVLVWFVMLRLTRSLDAEDTNRLRSINRVVPSKVRPLFERALTMLAA